MKCIMPWVYMNVLSDGSLQVCPMTSRRITNQNGQIVYIGAQGKENLFNSLRFKEIRLEMQKGEDLPECKRCRKDEALGMISKRILTNSDFSGYMNRFEETSVDGSTDHKPVALNIALGNTCNLACRMCIPRNSNKIAKALTEPSKSQSWKKYWEDEEINRNSSFRDYQKKFEFVDSLMPIFTDLLPNLNSLWLHGGEPTMSRAFKPLMNHIVEEKHYRRMAFGMTTNLVSLTWLKYMQVKWNKVVINYSIDGTGDVLEYIRYPIRWNVFKENLEHCLTYKDIEWVPCITLSALNVHNFPEILVFLDKTYKNFGRKLDFRINLLQYPSHLAIEALSKTMKEKIFDKIEKMSVDLDQVSNSLQGRLNLEKTKKAVLLRLQGENGENYRFNEFNESLDIDREQSLQGLYKSLS